MRLLGISGSLRKDSYNTKLLLAAAELMPTGITLVNFDCGDIPLYNKELDTEDKPEPVARLIQAISDCDGVLISSPEYNYSIPGVLKNAIDWASRPAYKSVLAGKPAAIMSASPSPVGGARAYAHLCQVFSATLTPVVPSPAFLVPMVQEKFDNNGTLQDIDTRRRLERYLQDFIAWVNIVAKL